MGKGGGDPGEGKIFLVLTLGYFSDPKNFLMCENQSANFDSN